MPAHRPKPTREHVGIAPHLIPQTASTLTGHPVLQASRVPDPVPGCIVIVGLAVRRGHVVWSTTTALIAPPVNAVRHRS